MSEAVNCPFYGRAFSIGSRRWPFVLTRTEGNQCALIVRSYAACEMEKLPEPVNWKRCPLIARIEGRHEDLSFVILGLCLKNGIWYES